MGGEPVLAAFKRDEVLRAPSADRGVEPESMEYAFGQSGSREAIGGDDQGRVEDETDHSLGNWRGSTWTRRCRRST